MNNSFIAKNLEISMSVKIHSYFAALFGRKDLLKEFCKKNGIGYKPEVGKKYQLPESYLIEHSELKYLSGIRDKSILAFSQEFVKCQQGTEGIRNDLIGRIDIANHDISTQKDKLARQEKQLSSARDPLLIIKYQNDIAVTKTSINNAINDRTELETELEKQNLTLESNKHNWEKQIDIINQTFSIQKDRFTKQLSKKVRKILHFTDFESNLLDYSKSVKKVIDGEYNND